MNEPSTLLSLEQPCDEAIAWVVSQVNEAGLQVVRTFDLQVAQYDSASCRCAYHGTDQCDCQMVVLLVYGDDYQPISLVDNSFDGRTLFSLVDTPQQRADPRLERSISSALSSQFLPKPRTENLPRAT